MDGWNDDEDDDYDDDDEENSETVDTKHGKHRIGYRFHFFLPCQRATN